MPDPQLLQYISAQRQAGHSDAEIKQILMKSGYAPLEAEAAFRSLNSSPMDPQLQNLAMQYLQSGMSPAQVTQALTSQGYSASSVHAAIKSCTGTAEPSHNHLATVFIIIAVIVGAGLLFVLLRDTGSSNPAQGMVTTNPNIIRADILYSLDKSDKADTDAAVKNCKQRLIDFSRDEVDNCILVVAIHEKVQNDLLCDQIIDPKLHDTCLNNFLNTKRFDDVCTRMKLVESKATCDNINALRAK